MCQSSGSKNVFNLISGLAFGQNNKQVKKIEPFIDISSNPQLKEKSDYKINISVKVKKNLLEESYFKMHQIFRIGNQPMMMPGSFANFVNTT